MDGSWGNYPKWNTSESEIYWIVSIICGIKITKENKLAKSSKKILKIEKYNWWPEGMAGKGEKKVVGQGENINAVVLAEDESKHAHMWRCTPPKWQ